ncbi:MAG TPA: hypothetical protein VK158_04505 [Acidobacteriota bacterium]|nr:hypothetical protein [Acidobacteriota bacterium]
MKRYLYLIIALFLIANVHALSIAMTQEYSCCRFNKTTLDLPCENFTWTKVQCDNYVTEFDENTSKAVQRWEAQNNRLQESPYVLFRFVIGIAVIILGIIVWLKRKK